MFQEYLPKRFVYIFRGQRNTTISNYYYYYTSISVTIGFEYKGTYRCKERLVRMEKIHTVKLNH